MLNAVINTVNQRFELAKSLNYNNYAEMVLADCVKNSPLEVIELLIKELNHTIPDHFDELSLTIEQALTDLVFEVADLLPDTFTINIYSDSNWFDDETNTVHLDWTKDQLLTEREVLFLWHEVFHLIHHNQINLNSLPPDLWELGAIQGEEYCQQYYGMRFRTGAQKDIAIAFVDMELACSTGITEQDVINIVEAVQNFTGVDLTLDDFNTIIYGQYGGCYFGYTLCRGLAREQNGFYKENVDVG